METGFRMLAHDRVDGIAGYDVVFDHHLKINGKVELFKKQPAFGHSEEYVIGRKNSPRTRELLEAFEQGKKIIIANGTYQKIVSKWL